MTYVNTGRDQELDNVSDISELDMEDRRELDDSVLQMLGVRSAQERKKLLDDLYAYLREFFEAIRQKEELAIVNKNRSKRKAAPSPAEIARQVLAEVKDHQGNLLRPFRNFVDLNEPYVTLDLPAGGLPEVHEDIFARDGSVRFVKGRKQIALVQTRNREQATLAALVALHGTRGLLRVPLHAGACAELKKRYERFLVDRDNKLRALVSDRTRDPDLKEQIFKALTSLIHHEHA
jgi:hypothetical protein